MTASPPTSCAESRFDGAGLGALQIGAAVEAVRRSCIVLRDTTEMREEGLPVRVLAVLIGRDTIEAEVNDGQIWRIAVLLPRFHTDDSLAVGTSTAHLLTLPDVFGMTGEGALYLVSPAHCGVSFRVTGFVPDSLDSIWSLAMLKRLPASSVVDRILINGCNLGE